MSNHLMIKRLSVWRLALCVMAMLSLIGNAAWAQSKTEKVFHAVTVDAKGVETDVKNLVFYWEEKISETAFVPHEVREVPVKRGTATVKVKFEGIKHIDLKPSGSGALPQVTITLNDGKTGEFLLAIAGSFKGQSDFGEVELPATDLKKVTFK